MDNLHPVRSRTAAFLLAIAFLVGPASLLVMYAARVVLNGEAFVSRVDASLQDPRVAGLLAERVTDQVIEQRRDLTALRPILITVMRSVVTSAPFRAMLRPAVRKAHDAILSSATEDVLLSMPDVSVLLRSTLANLSPAAAGKIPERLRGALVSRPGTPVARAALRVLHAVRDLRRFGRTGLLLAVLLLAASVALAPSRRAALLSAGAGVGATGFFLALCVPIGRYAVTAPVTDPAARAAVAGIWDALAGGLWIVGAVVGAIGLVCVAAATSVLQRVPTSEVARQVWASVSGRHPKIAIEILRVSGATAAGFLAFLYPTVALRVVMSVAGVVLFMIGLQGIFRLTLPYLPSALRKEDLDLRPAPTLLRAFRTAALLLAGLGAIAVVLRIRPAVTGAATVTDRCNGAVELCGRRLDRVTFAGAHNAMGSADNPRWLFPNQDLGVPALLERGVRAFMLDVHYGRRVGEKVKTDFDAEHGSADKFEAALGPEGFQAAMRIRDRMVGPSGPLEVYECHGFCELGAIPFDSTLRGVRDFVALNPGEVVLLILEDYVDPADVEKAFTESGLLEYVYRDTLGPTLPTLGELLAKGGRVLVLGEHNVGNVPWYHPAWDLTQETPYTFHKPEDFSCRPNRGAATNPLFLMNHWIETTPAPRPSSAEAVNTVQVLVGRARRCARERGRMVNLIAVDFAGTGDVVGAVEVLNGLTPMATAVQKGKSTP